MPIAFLAAKETEAKNLRLVATAAARGLDRTLVRAELALANGWPEAS